MSANILLLAVVAGFVLQEPVTDDTKLSDAILATEEESLANPLDTLSSADIALNVATVSELPEQVSVANLADTVNAQLTVTPADDIVVTQPQLISTGLKSRANIQDYKVKEGDTVASVAKKFGITSDTIRWSNGITGDSLQTGQTIVISPISGLVYTVESGDTIDDLVAKYRVEKAQFIAFNDLETGKLPVGEKVIMPNGQPPEPTVSRSTSSRSRTSSAPGFSPSYGNANGYSFGYCTWWAANRRSATGRAIPSNLGNASTWLSRASSAGLATGRAPRAGAVIWTHPRDFYGHVGYVESVNGDGSVNISEMNTTGWNRVSRRTLTAGEAAGYSYIY